MKRNGVAQYLEEFKNKLSKNIDNIWAIMEFNGK